MTGDFIEFKDTYIELDKLYHRYDLSCAKKVLFINSLDSILVPFLKLKHTQFSVENNLQVFNVIDPPRFDLIVIFQYEIDEHLLNKLLENNGFFIEICSPHSNINFPGIKSIYNNGELDVVLYKKIQSFHRITQGNEFNHLEPADLSYEVLEADHDVSVSFSWIDQRKARMLVVRFDGEFNPDNLTKLRVYNRSASVEIIAQLGISFCDFPFNIEKSKKYTPLHVPNVICQTLNEDIVGEMHFQTVNHLKAMNPEFDYQFFDAPMRRNFIKSNFDQMVLEVYDGLVSGAFKADVFRYCWLYVCGGVYIDCKMINRTPLRDFIADQEVYLCKDRIPNAYQNCFIAASPKNESILQCIRECVNRFESKINHRVSFGSLYHTGPYLFYSCMKKFSPDCVFEGPFKSTDYRDHVIRETATNKILFNVYYKDYYQNYSAIHKRPIWSQQWAQNEIYYSEKFPVENLHNITIMIYPNQLKTIPADLSFKYIDNSITNNLFENLKCKVIDETLNTESIISVRSKYIA
jgi:mannosyltransferase OCH1-like enzyme